MPKTMEHLRGRTEGRLDGQIIGLQTAAKILGEEPNKGLALARINALVAGLKAIQGAQDAT